MLREVGNTKAPRVWICTECKPLRSMNVSWRWDNEVPEGYPHVM